MAAEVFGADRIMFGSDYPLEAKTPEEVAEIPEGLYRVGLEGDALPLAESGNADRLLRTVRSRG